MRAQLRLDELGEALIAVRGVAGGKQLPILSGVRISAKADGVELTATNLDLSLRKRLSASIKEAGTSIVPHDLINGFVHHAESESISLHSRRGELLLVAEGAKAVLPEFDPTNWPELPTADGSWSAWSSEVLNAVAAVLHAAARPESGQSNLAGVLIADSYAVATDGRRLAVAELPEQIAETALVPAETIRLIAAAPGKGCAVRIGTRVAEFRKAETDCLARLIEHDYPDWRSSIPDSLPGILTVDRRELQVAVEMARFFADPTTAEIKLRPGGGSISIAAGGAAAVEDTMEAVTNLDVPIVVNGRFLAEALKPLTSPSVSLHFTADRARFVIREEHLTQMVMTIRRV